MNQETIDKIDNIGLINAHMDEMFRLHRPLIAMFAKKRYEMDIEGAPREGRTFSLSKVEYREQYEAGIDRIVGFDIVWMEDVPMSNEDKKKVNLNPDRKHKFVLETNGHFEPKYRCYVCGGVAPKVTGLTCPGRT